jgi:hypothetical protein
MLATPSDLLYDAVWHSSSVQRDDWLAVPNEVRGEDYFSFAPENQMASKYFLLRSLIGGCDFAIADKPYWERQRGGLEHLYHRFFRRRSAHIPAFWWVWGRVPVRAMSMKTRVIKREEAQFGFVTSPTRGQEARSHPLGLSGGTDLEIPRVLLRPVEKKIVQRIAFGRRLSLRESDTGTFQGLEYHNEIQLGTPDNAEAIRQGRFELSATDRDILPLVETSNGRWYFDGFAVYLVRAIPIREISYGLRYSECRFEAVYLSYRLIGCTNKVGTVQGNFNPWALTYPHLCRTLIQINPFGKWV